MHISMVYTPSHNKANIVAKLAISIARKIGAVIFLLPEDITQVRARLVKIPAFRGLTIDFNFCREFDGGEIVSRVYLARISFMEVLSYFRAWR